MYATRQLESLGYRYVPGPSGDPSDLLLRQTNDEQKGFEWKGQADYDALGDAVVAYCQGQLTSLCGLEALPLPTGGAAANTVVYGSPGFMEHTGPMLILVCGAPPGGAAGVWGRKLCINDSLLQGAMFDYALRGKRLGWSILIANPNVTDVGGVPVPGSECSHQHLRTLWKSYVEPSLASRVLVVAHSYGSGALAHLLKVEESARERVSAVAFTDAWASPKGSILQEKMPPMDTANLPPPGTAGHMLLQNFEHARAAFEPPSEAFAAKLAEVGRNFVQSQLPAGTPIAASHTGVTTASAGAEDHAATTHASTQVVFEFLQKGAEGRAGQANDEFRQRCEM